MSAISSRSERKQAETPSGHLIPGALLSPPIRDGKSQIYVIGARGGEAGQLAAEENGVVEFDWSPDGKMIAYVAKNKATKDRRDKYGDFEVIGGDYAMQHIFAVGCRKNFLRTQSSVLNQRC